MSARIATRPGSTRPRRIGPSRRPESGGGNGRLGGVNTLGGVGGYPGSTCPRSSVAVISGSSTETLTNRAAAFEAVMLIRCAAPITTTRRRLLEETPATRLSVDVEGVLVEFGQPAAAHRMARLLAVLGIDAEVETRWAGGRHRYEIYRVRVNSGHADLVRTVLEDAWRAGYGVLCRFPEQYLTRWQQRDRVAFATGAWRAALLAAGRRKSTTLALRIAESETTAVLVRAAQVLGIQTLTQSRTGYQLVVVGSGLSMDSLFGLVPNTAGRTRSLRAG